MHAVFFVLLILLGACGDDDDVSYGCVNGSCACFEGERCSIGCASPPCHIDCEPGSLCDADCANGTCTCEDGSDCAFGCASPPCHVHCERGTDCTGECENGGCTCGDGSSCYFTCLDSNCGVSCGSGSSCVLECAQGRAGEGHCDFDRCDGDEVSCGGGVIACNAPCPE